MNMIQIEEIKERYKKDIYSGKFGYSKEQADKIYNEVCETIDETNDSCKKANRFANVFTVLFYVISYSLIIYIIFF